MTAVTLAATLNAMFSLRLASPAEARAWLADGGWPRLDAWLETHRADPDQPRPEETPA